jgi:hypothetical protein
MRRVVLRLSRILVVALAASLVLGWARSRGFDRVGWAVATASLAALLALSLLGSIRSARTRREQRWEAAFASPQRRPGAIRELRRALARSPRSERGRGEHTRLSLLLAELLDAENQYAEATAVADAIALDSLSPVEAGLVRHTRAVTHLRGGQPNDALRALEGRAPSGDLELDQRLGLLETYARLELGDAHAALAHVAALEASDDLDESVSLEARVVRAAALDALGRREEALITLAALGRESLTPLAELGQPRVRALAQQVLEGLES